jgi:hypothetical protein
VTEVVVDGRKFCETKVSVRARNNEDGRRGKRKNRREEGRKKMRVGGGFERRERPVEREEKRGR